MSGVNRIDVKLDRKTFNIVLGTFCIMHDHYGEPGIIDPAAVLITPQDVADLIDKLRNSDKGGDEVTISMNFSDWTVYGTLLSHTSANIPQTDPDAYAVLDFLHEEYGRVDDAGEAPSGPEVVKPAKKNLLMWQLLCDTEKEDIAARIDVLEPLHRYGANAGSICEIGLTFYPGARLLRVGSRTPAVGSRYFLQRGDELIPLFRLPEVQSFCDKRFDIVLDSTTAADYFRFAHFFSEEGRTVSLVEGPQDLRIDPSSSTPANRQAIAFIRPLEFRRDKDGFTVTACTFDERHSRLCRDRYSLVAEQPLQLLSREDSGINLGHPFVDTQLQIGRSDLFPLIG
jgi:hypothetical protein